MSGIGVGLNKIYKKNNLTTNLCGSGYGIFIAVVPAAVIAVLILLLQYLPVASRTGYAMREWFFCTILYISIFSLLAAAPFFLVLSRYLIDALAKEEYADVRPCYYTGLMMTVALSCLFGIPFCIHEYVAGAVGLWYVFAGYCGYLSMVFFIYSMPYLLVYRDYKKLVCYFAVGMAATVFCFLLLIEAFHMEAVMAMLFSLNVGLLAAAVLEHSLIRSRFQGNSGRYREVWEYLKQNRRLAASEFVFVLGLFAHNFVFWTTGWHMVAAHSFVSMTSYDLAAFFALLTNVASVMLSALGVYGNFHGRYQAYLKAVKGGRGIDIENAKGRMFRQLSEELFNLMRIQFVISIAVYFIFRIFLPKLGFGGMIVQIYPCLTAAFYILFIMYTIVIFLYHFDDVKGALLTGFVFFTVTLAVSFSAVHLSEIWYGIGAAAGAFAGFTTGYFRLRWVERNLDELVFCRGDLLKKGTGICPSNKVLDRYYRRRSRRRKGNK